MVRSHGTLDSLRKSQSVMRIDDMHMVLRWIIFQAPSLLLVLIQQD